MDGLVGGIGIWFERFGASTPVAPQVGVRDPVGCEQSELGAHFKGHVADREPTGHVCPGHSGSGEFNRPVLGTIGAEAAGEVQDHVLP